MHSWRGLRGMNTPALPPINWTELEVKPAACPSCSSALIREDERHANPDILSWRCDVCGHRWEENGEPEGENMDRLTCNKWQDAEGDCEQPAIPRSPYGYEDQT